MDIITRNMFRLLRAGVLGRDERVEPMSAWKWSKAYSLTMVHGVEAEAWAGVRRLSGQFFMQLPSALCRQWEQSAATATPAPRTPLPRRLAERLDRIEDHALNSREFAVSSRGFAVPVPRTTMSVLRSMVVLSQSLLTADRWVRQLLSIATLLSPAAVPPRIDRELLQEWVEELGMERMAQLECALLETLMHIDPERLPLLCPPSEGPGDAERIREVEETVATIEATTHQWHYSQGSNIFVHNSDSAAMYWQARHSVRYLKYHPKQSISSFLSSFVKSLTNIEE